MWEREKKFIELLEGQSGKLTKDGLELLTRIAVQDEKECFKHVSVLLERQMRRVKLKYRTNVLHVLSYVLRKSFMKFKAENKYAKRLSSRIVSIFELLKECNDDQKGSISRVLLAWSREHIFCKPIMEEIYEALGWRPEEPVLSPVAQSLHCSYDSYAEVVENIPKEKKDEGDVSSGRGNGQSSQAKEQANDGHSRAHSSNHAHIWAQADPADRWSGNCARERRDTEQGALEERQWRTRKRGLSGVGKHRCWRREGEPPIAPDPYYSRHIVDPDEVSQPCKKRKGNFPDKSGVHHDEDSMVTSWLTEIVDPVMKSFTGTNLSIFDRAQAIACAISSAVKEHGDTPAREAPVTPFPYL